MFPSSRFLHPGSRPAAFLGLMLLAASLNPASAQTYLFDFGGAGITTQGAAPADDPVNAWNNITTTIGSSDTGILNGVVSTGNTASSISLVMISRFNAANENGTAASSLFPGDATRDSLYGNTEAFNNLTGIFPSFKLTGLNPDTSHNLRFYASRTGVSDNRETDYTVTGLTSTVVSLNAAGNTEQTVTVEGMKPDASGEITISLAPGVNNNNANHFTYLGVLELVAIPVQQPVVFSAEPADVTSTPGQTVTFTATVNSTPPYSIQWHRNGEDIEGATQFSYTIPAVDPGMDNTRYSVTVSNLQFSATSREATLRVNSDAVPPAISSAQGQGPYLVTLVFSEELDSATATDPNNYVLDGGNNITSTAALQADRKTVVLTPALALGATATVEVNNVTDLALNPVAAGAQATIQVPQPDGKSFLIDFGGGDTTSQGSGNDDPLNDWNNVPASLAQADGSILSDLKRNNGEFTSVSLTVVSRFNGANTAGTLTGGPFPPDATRDSLFGNTGVFQSLSDIFPVIRLGGLDPAQEHELVFYASRMDPVENRTTRYTVTGATETFTELNAANNIGNTATLSGVRPDANGDITIALTPGETNTTAEKFTYLGVLKVTPGATTSNPAAPVLLPPVVSGGNVTLSWTGTGLLEWSTSLTGSSWNAVNPAPSPPYTEPLVPGQRKFFRLRY